MSVSHNKRLEGKKEEKQRMKKEKKKQKGKKKSFNPNKKFERMYERMKTQSAPTRSKMIINRSKGIKKHKR